MMVSRIIGPLCEEAIFPQVNSTYKGPVMRNFDGFFFVANLI